MTSLWPARAHTGVAIGSGGGAARGGRGADREQGQGVAAIVDHQGDAAQVEGPLDSAADLLQLAALGHAAGRSQVLTLAVDGAEDNPERHQAQDLAAVNQRQQQAQAFLLCGWLAGLRLNEALALEREETDQAPWIVFPAGFVKAEEDQWVPLDPDLAEVLDSLPRHGRKVFRLQEDRSGKLVGDVAVSNRVTELARQAGVRLSMKSLRRGFGCRYAAKVPAQVLQRLMRHASIKTTMDYYANVDDAVMEAVLGGRRNSSRNKRARQERRGRPVDDESRIDTDTSD
jgi:hypothetical protein